MRIFGLPLVCLALAASSLTIAQPVAAVELTCLGKTATVAQHRGTVTGTPRDDVIVLTGRGWIIARDGNDLVCGSPGADLIVGATGTDKVISGPGPDSVSQDGNFSIDFLRKTTPRTNREAVASLMSVARKVSDPIGSPYSTPGVVDEMDYRTLADLTNRVL